MTKKNRDPITSGTIQWTDGEVSVVTKVLQTEIQVRRYAAGCLLGGSIYPMSEQQKGELYAVFAACLSDWDCEDYSTETNKFRWQFRLCAKHGCLRTVCGTTAPPPHGEEIKKKLTDIVGEEDCCFY